MVPLRGQKETIFLVGLIGDLEGFQTSLCNGQIMLGRQLDIRQGLGIRVILVKFSILTQSVYKIQ